MYEFEQLHRLEEELTWKEEEWNKLIEFERVLNTLKSAKKEYYISTGYIDKREIMEINQKESEIGIEKSRNRAARLILVGKITRLRNKYNI